MSVLELWIFLKTDFAHNNSQSMLLGMVSKTSQTRDASGFILETYLCFISRSITDRSTF